MKDPSPATASYEADVDAAVADFHDRIATDPSTWTSEMRRSIVHRLVTEATWRTPAASADAHGEAFAQDLNTIGEIAWFSGLDHGEVRRMRDEHLATTGEIERENEMRELYWERSRQRVRLSLAVHYRRRRLCSQRSPVMRTRSHRRGPRRPRAQATRSSARSGDGPDSSEPHRTPVAPHRPAPSRVARMSSGLVTA